MSRQESNPRGHEQYQPIPRLLQNLNTRLKIAPWDLLKLELPGGIRRVDPRQLAPIERLSVFGNSEQADLSNFRPINNYRRGFLSGVDVHTGTVALHLPNEAPASETVFIQYAHSPREQYDERGNPVFYNDGIANVLIQTNGTIQALAMLSNGDYLLYSFASPNSGNVGLGYPEDEVDALNKIKQATPQIVDRFLPLLGKLSILTAAASDIYLDRKRDSSEGLMELLRIPEAIRRYAITKDSMDPELAKLLGVSSNEHPLKDLIDERHLPQRFDIVELEGYDEFIRTLGINGIRYPTFFRSHELGMYFSSKSPWDDESVADGIREVLGYNGVVDMERGLIIPAIWPEDYTDSWNQRLEYIKHQMLLQAYEDVPADERRELLRQCGEIVENSVDLRYHTYLNTEVPEKDPSSPYAFRNYSLSQQEKILAGFIAGTLALNKDLYIYWAGPHLHGNGTNRLDWAPKGALDLIEDHGFLVSRAPASTIHPHYVRHVTRDGEIEKSDRPFANPDLKVADDGTVKTVKPKDLSEVIVLPGFSFLPPLERLHRDLEQLYGFNLTFPTSTPEEETHISEFIPLEEELHASAIRTIAQELEKYPPNYIQRLELAGIRVLGGISEIDRDKPDKKAPLGGLASHWRRIIYFVFGPASSGIIHHEIRHIADTVYGIVDNDAWASLNPNGSATYSRKRYVDLVQEAEENPPAQPGFISFHATMNEDEDRAYLAEMLFTKPSIFIREASKDNVLKAKIDALLQILEVESQGVMDKDWSEKFLYNPHPFTDPVIFAQTISHGYLTHPYAYFEAKMKLARM